MASGRARACDPYLMHLRTYLKEAALNVNQVLRDLREACESKWPTPSASDSYIWLTTEVGELGDELARIPGFLDVVATRSHPRDGSLANVRKEAADVLIMLASVCEHFGIDLNRAYAHRVQELLRRYGR